MLNSILKYVWIGPLFLSRVEVSRKAWFLLGFKVEKMGFDGISQDFLEKRQLMNKNL